MKQAIFTVVNGAWINELNVFVESWIKDKPSDVDYILVHDGTLDTSRLNHQPDLLTVIPKNYINRLQKSEAHRYLKTGWKINSARIFMMDILKGNYDKLLYFDADTIVVDLPAFLDYCPEKTIAAVEAEFTRESIGMVSEDTGLNLSGKVRIIEQRLLNPSGYINNGVMIIDANRLRNIPFNISELFIRTFKELVFIDQDFINLAFSEDIEYLDRSFNVIPLPTMEGPDKEVVEYSTQVQEYYDRAVSSAKAFHYISGWRPWQPSKLAKSDILDVTVAMEAYMKVIRRTPNIDPNFAKSAEENYLTYVRK